jgi:hypothetical protein
MTQGSPRTLVLGGPVLTQHDARETHEALEVEADTFG